MLLSQLLEATTPVVIQRGGAKFTLDAALEKFTPGQGEYQNLCAAELEAEVVLDGIARRISETVLGINALSDLDALRAEMQIALAEKSKRKKPSDFVISEDALSAEFERRLHELQTNADTLRTEKDAAIAVVKKYRARRLAYLIAGSDIINADGTSVLSGAIDKTAEQLEADAMVFVKNFSAQLLDHCLAEVEKAVFAPLETAG